MQQHVDHNDLHLKLIWIDEMKLVAIIRSIYLELRNEAKRIEGFEKEKNDTLRHLQTTIALRVMIELNLKW
jgi:hypothetical protein